MLAKQVDENHSRNTGAVSAVLNGVRHLVAARSTTEIKIFSARARQDSISQASCKVYTLPSNHQEFHQPEEDCKVAL